jgi:pimeloyl-ACP methyl ester carboxylesterase
MFVKVHELNMFYRVFRDNAEAQDLIPSLKTMIVLHGGFGLIDHQIEVSHWREFSKLVQVVFIDQRGCGRTEGGTIEGYSLKKYGEDIFGFCQSLKIVKPIIAGISAGGMAIMAYLTKHSDHPGAIILCNTEAKKSAEARKAAFLKFGSTQAAEAVDIFDSDPANIEKSKLFFETCVPYFSKNEFSLVPAFKEDWGIWKKFAVEWSTSMDYREALKKAITCPVLFLAGEDDPNHPLESSIETANSIPEKYRHFHVIAKTGAPVYQDQPEAFKKLINDFIKENLR